MKQIISGKRYDTETATYIGSHSNGYSYSDFAYCCETLYRKRTGEYFLHGDGGAMSKYRVYSGDNSWGGGEKLVPLTYKDAEEWAKENLSADDFEKEFGAVSEDDTDTIIVKLAAPDGAKLRRIALDKGISVTALITRMIREL